jgi:hypothetical protein
MPYNGCIALSLFQNEIAGFTGKVLHSILKPSPPVSAADRGRTMRFGITPALLTMRH